MLPIPPAFFICIGLLFQSQPEGSAAADSSLGIFEGHGDIGHVLRPGSATYDPATKSYRIGGSGENMWFTNDAFHFVYREVSGDFALEAAVEWLRSGGNAHRKACLLVRQDLSPDSAYVDVAVHGNGLTALQYRDEPEGVTHEIQSPLAAPARVRLEKRGDYISLWLAAPGEDLKPAGGYLRIPFTGTFYVGLGVCAHNNKAIESAKFANVQLTPMTTPATAQPAMECSLETVAIASGDRRVVYRTRDHIEAPNWSRDGKFFLFNRSGRIYRLAATGDEPQPIDTGNQTRCNNDHGLSPDGTQLAISDQTDGGKSRIYVLPATGGTPRCVTPQAPSYWHGWSPDGKTLAYCAQRHGEFDVYTTAVDGGEETRLTTAAGLDDGPEYSPDGLYIYFNSDRTGRMQIWRMKPDGSEQEQVTDDDCNNWFAHPSPNGRWIVFLSYDKDVKGHPANKDVLLRLMSLPDRKIRVLARLFGGQGTINVPSWSPDSRNVAFVSYQMVYP